MGVLRKLAFWKKKELPDLPEELSPLQGPTEFPQYDERPFPQDNFQQSRRYTPPPQFDEPIRQDSSNSQFQIISSKLDVLNAKIEVLSERISNLDKRLNEPRTKW